MKTKSVVRILALALTTVMTIMPVQAEAASIYDKMDAKEPTVGEAVADDSYTAENETSDQVAADQNSVSENGTILTPEQVYSYSGYLNAEKMSKSYIRDQLTDIYLSRSYPKFAITPNAAAPYALGAMSTQHENATLDSVNLMRCIAGLDKIAVHATYRDYAQHGAVVLAANDALTHTPSQPAGMDSTFYDKGYTGTSQGNIAYGRPADYFDAPRFTLGYMEDDQSFNVETVGHRRWILNPKMAYTGFGFAVSPGNSAYSVMYAFDSSATVKDYDFIAWPASGNFPIELGTVKMPWHVTLNPNKFNISALNIYDVEVTITAPDGTVQIIDGLDCENDAGSPNQSYFTINKNGYGVANAIIFRPGSGTFKDPLNGVYTVTITGIKTKGGADATLSYNIDFFEATADAAPPESDTNEDAVTNFVQRLYTLCFGRKADDGGMANWKGALVRHSKSGAEVAWGFFFSDEMKNRNLSDAEFVELLYLVMMDRTYDEGGKKYWLDAMAAGMSREGVFRGFAESQEFQKVCDDYGIIRGSVNVAQGRDKSVGLTMFVSRLYTKALGRDYDVNGLNDWCNRITNKTWSVHDVATTGFFSSPEFLQKNLSNEEYVKVLYWTFFDREYDEAGYNDWVGKLNSGQLTREQVLRGFSDSREFAKLMRSFGL
ncbi:MAG: DUF4214 domain-containing protein [Lachnospiraceae bacterium]|nr:DUF4214 domain-containing protein [Lachnospiraceae bacterium]